MEESGLALLRVTMPTSPGENGKNNYNLSRNIRPQNRHSNVIHPEYTPRALVLNGTGTSKKNIYVRNKVKDCVIERYTFDGGSMHTYLCNKILQYKFSQTSLQYLQVINISLRLK
jgi:hypothetical protein